MRISGTLASFLSASRIVSMARPVNLRIVGCPGQQRPVRLN
jgi:hypothetical protein